MEGPKAMTSLPPANKSAYVAPTTIPKPAPHTTMESELVKLSPEADPRNAPTQLSLKAVKRHERRLSWIAFVAGAAGALIASLVYLDVFTHDGSHAVTKSNDGSRADVASDANTASPVPTAAHGDAVSERTAALDVSQLPLVPDRFAAATETPPRRATNTERAESEDGEEPKRITGSKPSPARTESAEAEIPNPSTEPGPAKREPETPAPPAASTSKVWVEPPPRKVWVE